MICAPPGAKSVWYCSTNCYLSYQTLLTASSDGSSVSWVNWNCSTMSPEWYSPEHPLLRDKHLQERTSSKHSPFLIFPENYNLRMQEAIDARMEKIKIPESYRKKSSSMPKFSKVHLWTVFSGWGRRRCSENICVHNCLKYHVSYFWMQVEPLYEECPWPGGHA